MSQAPSNKPDSDKTKEELLNELESLRNEVDYLRQREKELSLAKAQLEQSVAEKSAELFAREKLLSEFFNAAANVGIGLGIHDKNKRFLALNQALADINSVPLAEHFGKTVADSSARLVRLINDILDLERFESGKVTLLRESCNAATIMQQSVEAMRASAEQNNITFCVTPLDALVWAAPDAIVQTITNLLSNAVKFSEPGSTIWLNAQFSQVKVGIQENLDSSSPSFNPDCVIFCVKDSGRGIPPDKLETVFEQFQQVDASDSRQKGGTGLGLAICRSIIRQHGGQIWVESTLGKGSTFFFTLPVYREFGMGNGEWGI